MLVGAHVSSSYSVARINEIEVEANHLTGNLLEALFFMLGGALAAVVAHASKVELTASIILFDGVFRYGSVLGSLFQGLVVGCSAVAIDRLRLVVSLFKKVQSLKFDAMRDDPIMKNKKAGEVIPANIFASRQ